MRTSQYLLATLKEKPADAELISHQLMLRAGMIRKLASGIYTWLPMGLRVLRKVERVVREEMERVNALELLLPAVQPSELWQESERWQQYGAELLRFTDRHEREFCFGPTHEEVITDVMRKELRSYKQLPLTLYQIQTKFRDEIRPRFGVMRGREFLMKDAYSFHLDETSLGETYAVMFAAYQRIFTRLGLHFRAVEADSGAIGGKKSHEFQVLAKSGEDIIVSSDGSDYAANQERASCLPDVAERPAASGEMVATNALTAPLEQQIKVVLVNGHNEEFVAIALRGDHELNSVKAEHHPLIAEPLTLADAQEVQRALNCSIDRVSLLGLKESGIPLLVDREAANLADFACSATDGGYWQSVNWGRDLPEPDVFELRNVVAGDKSPDGQGTLQISRGIEVGHVFQLGNKYSQAMKLTVLGENGKAVTPLMGCYGLGVSRVVAAAIEQHHDDNGIIWPEAMAPFQVILSPMNYHKSHRVREFADNLYQQLCEMGIEVLLDDRKERPGILFATADLLGISHRVVVSERGVDGGTVEYKARGNRDSEILSVEGVLGVFG